MWLFVGLGNPGPEYETTRHNAGFIFLDLLHEKLKSQGPWKDQKAFEGITAQGSFEGIPCILLKPMTFMNLSGRSVQKVAHFYKIPAENVFPIYDDVDCAPGTTKLRMDGGHGGHNGMRSIIECLGTNVFPRLKLGIGKPEKGANQGDTSSWVLGRMTDQELEILQTKMFEEGLARLRSVVIKS